MQEEKKRLVVGILFFIDEENTVEKWREENIWAYQHPMTDE